MVFSDSDEVGMERGVGEEEVDSFGVLLDDPVGGNLLVEEPSPHTGLEILFLQLLRLFEGGKLDFH